MKKKETKGGPIRNGSINKGKKKMTVDGQKRRKRKQKTEDDKKKMRRQKMDLYKMDQ